MPYIPENIFLGLPFHFEILPKCHGLGHSTVAECRGLGFHMQRATFHAHVLASWQ